MHGSRDPDADGHLIPGRPISIGELGLLDFEMGLRVPSGPAEFQSNHAWVRRSHMPFQVTLNGDHGNLPCPKESRATLFRSPLRTIVAKDLTAQDEVTYAPYKPLQWEPLTPTGCTVCRPPRPIQLKFNRFLVPERPVGLPLQVAVLLLPNT